MGLKTVIISQKVTQISELNTYSAKYVVEVWGDIAPTDHCIFMFCFHVGYSR